ncbi:MAG: LVIVD repeat-containing protein, partial [Candidatus Heimdallarchaeaceae archaeon]
SDAELAHAVLNRTYAEEENLVNLGTYIPHNWISVRPAFQDLDFDQATSYKILYDATYQGKDYSFLTGESGSAKFFLDLVRGLDYEEPDDLSVDVQQLLSDIYDIDTPEERDLAKSFAAYMNYLLGRPSLDWLYENQISYVCKRTAMEWILGIEDPLLENRKYPLVWNQTLSSSSIDLNTDTYYAEKLGTYEPSETGNIIGIANIPYYHDSRSSDVFYEDGIAYVIEGGTDIKVVNTTSPMFLALGQYGDYDFTVDPFGDVEDVLGHAGRVKAITVVEGYVYAAEGDRGIEVLNATNPSLIVEIDQWNNLGRADMNDIDYAVLGFGIPFTTLFIANGQYGVTSAVISTTPGSERQIGTTTQTIETNGTAIAIDVNDNNRHAFAALGTDGLNVIDVDDSTGSIELLYWYDSSNFSNLKNVIDVKAKGRTLYVLDQIEGMLIFDIAFNGTLTERGQYAFNPAETHYSNFFIDENTGRAYLAQGDYGLTVVNVANADNPTEMYRYNGTEHLGSALGVFVSGTDIYLADYSEGLLKLEYNTFASRFDELARDELHTYVENWFQSNKQQFDDWTLEGTELDFNETYSSFSVFPYVEKGLRQQWSEFFYRSFVFSSLTDTALFYDEIVFVYTAQSGLPYRQFDRSWLYWMTETNFVNTTFIHVGHWNQMYDLDWDPTDFIITHSLPGQPRDPFHMHTMMVEPTTGSVVESRERVQYNTQATRYVEPYSLLNETKYGTDINAIPEIHYYRTWHITNPGLTGNMGTLFWREDVRIATQKYYDFLQEQFLERIEGADASRTLGAFGSLFLVTLGFAVTSVVLYRTSPKFSKKK